MMKITSKSGWFSALKHLLPIFIKASPVLFLVVCIIGVTNSAFFVLDTFVMRGLIDGATDLAENHVAVQQVVWYVVVFGIVKLLQQVINGASNYFAEYWDNSMGGKLQILINKKCSSVEPILYEKVEFLDDLEKSSEGMQNCVSLVSVSLIILTNSIPYIIFISLFLFSVKPIFVIAVLLIFIPLLINHLFTSKLYTKLEDNVAPLRRELNYYETCICDKNCYKDTRMLGIYSFFKNLFTRTLSQMSQLELSAQKKSWKRNVLSKIITMAGYFSVLVLLVTSTIHKEISIGSFSAVFYSLATLVGLLDELIDRHIGSLTKNIGTIRNFLNVLEYPERKVNENQVELSGNILVNNVSFQYPNSDRNALNHVSFQIRHNETTAIVGVNGSGKTTLIKLLLGILTPTSGEIRYGDEVSSVISAPLASAVFQDYQKYRFSLEKNVYISDVVQKYKEEEVSSVLQQADIDPGSNTFPMGLQTVLSKEFGGVDVSIGQWQRIAIARGYYRSHSLIILDEPTAAIDPLEEDRLYRAFHDMSKNKTSIIVTHRLGAARIADRIIVLNNGVLDSMGTHDELMEIGGLYKTIFISQAQWYYEKESELAML